MSLPGQMVFVMVIFCVSIPKLSGLKQQAFYYISGSLARCLGVAWLLLFHMALTGVIQWHSAADELMWRIQDGVTDTPGAFVGLARMLRPDYWREHLSWPPEHGELRESYFLHGNLFPHGWVLEETQAEACKTFSDLALEVPEHHCHILFIKQVTNASPDVRGGKRRLSSLSLNGILYRREETDASHPLSQRQLEPWRLRVSAKWSSPSDIFWKGIFKILWFVAAVIFNFSNLG